MKNRSILIILLISFGLSLTLGLLDSETQSLIHLLTAEPANVVALLLYTAVFSLAGFTILGLGRLGRK